MISATKRCTAAYLVQNEVFRNGSFRPDLGIVYLYFPREI